MSQPSVTAKTEFEQRLEQFDAVVQSNPSEALTIAQSSLALATTQHQCGKVYVRLGLAQRLLSQLHNAEINNNKALEIFLQHNDLENHTLALISAGAIEIYSGKREQAYHHLMKALEQSRTIQHKLYEARACNTLGALFDWYSNASIALEYLLEALRLMRELQETMMENIILSNIGAIHYRQGEYEKALEYYNTSLEGLRILGAELHIAHGELNIAESLIKLNRPTEAETIIQNAIQGVQNQQDILGESFALRTLGTARLAQQKNTDALTAFQTAYEIADKHQLLEEKSLAQLGIGQAHIALGQANQALTVLAQARQGLSQSSAENQLEVLKAIVTANEQLGQYKEALETQRQYTALEQQYRETNSQRYVQSLMLRFELSETQREATAAIKRNKDLESVIQEKEQLTAELERLSLQDPLTGLYNRRYLEQHFAQLLEVFQNQAHDVTVALLDIDHFKNINDQYSHLIGDQVLRQIAQLLLKNLRPSDITVRFGGEEFLVILPSTNPEIAYTLAERLRKNVQQHAWYRIHQHLQVTISIGLATLEATDTTEQLLTRADQNLYKAKQNGRNQVIKN